MLWWEASLLLVAFALAALVVIYSFRAGISPMPSGLHVKAAILSLLPPETTGTIVDLGSGWGTLVFPIALRCRRAKVLGYEMSPVPWAFSLCRKLVGTHQNLQLKRNDFFDISLHEATTVVCYLYTDAMTRLACKLQEELRPGARVMSHTFAIPGWFPIRVIQLHDLFRTPIYIYEIPLSLPTKDTFEAESPNLNSQLSIVSDPFPTPRRPQ